MIAPVVIGEGKMIEWRGQAGTKVGFRLVGAIEAPFVPALVGHIITGLGIPANSRVLKVSENGLWLTMSEVAEETVVNAKHEWVVGFLLDGDRVVLIRKNRPAWQAGRLNGVGGKVEPTDRTLTAAMTREFQEETGLHWFGWERYACLNWEEGVVHFYRGFATAATLNACATMTDEAVEIHAVHELLTPGPLRDGVTPNLLWLVPLAAHRHDTYDVIDVVETGTTMRKPGRLDLVSPAPTTEGTE